MLLFSSVLSIRICFLLDLVVFLHVISSDILPSVSGCVHRCYLFGYDFFWIWLFSSKLSFQICLLVDLVFSSMLSIRIRFLLDLVVFHHVIYLDMHPSGCCCCCPLCFLFGYASFWIRLFLSVLYIRICFLLDLFFSSSLLFISDMLPSCKHLFSCRATISFFIRIMLLWPPVFKFGIFWVHVYVFLEALFKCL